jgi:hypothetical protein
MRTESLHIKTARCKNDRLHAETLRKSAALSTVAVLFRPSIGGEITNVSSAARRDIALPLDDGVCIRKHFPFVDIHYDFVKFAPWAGNGACRQLRNVSVK